MSVDNEHGLPAAASELVRYRKARAQVMTNLQRLSLALDRLQAEMAMLRSDAWKALALSRASLNHNASDSSNIRLGNLDPSGDAER